MPLPSRRAQARTVVSLFAALGAQVGAFAVLIPDLVASRGLRPAALGAALALEAAVSIATLAAAGALADRRGRRPLAVAGLGGFAVAFALLAAVEAPAAVWPTMALYGVAGGCLDLASNASGADFERAHRVRAMIRFHAGFSAAAALAAPVAAAVTVLAGHRAAYAAVSAGFAVMALAATRAPLPRAGRRASASAAAGRGVRLLAVPGVAFAAALCTLCFFGDGALQAYSALLLRDVQAAGPLAAGAALAAFHAASLAGRLGFARVLEGTGERALLMAAGGLAAAAMSVVVAAGSAALAAGGLLVVGLALSPIVPTLLSLAGRAAPSRSAQAVALVTSVGYSAFVLAPPLVGAVAQATSLRAGLGVVVASTGAIALVSAVAPTRLRRPAAPAESARRR